MGVNWKEINNRFYTPAIRMERDASGKWNLPLDIPWEEGTFYSPSGVIIRVERPTYSVSPDFKVAYIGKLASDSSEE